MISRRTIINSISHRLFNMLMEATACGRDMDVLDSTVLVHLSFAQLRTIALLSLIRNIEKKLRKDIQRLKWHLENPKVV